MIIHCNPQLNTCTQIPIAYNKAPLACYLIGVWCRRSWGHGFTRPSVMAPRYREGFYSAHATSMPSPQRLGLQGLMASCASQRNANTRIQLVLFSSAFSLATRRRLPSYERTKHSELEPSGSEFHQARHKVHNLSLRRLSSHRGGVCLRLERNVCNVHPSDLDGGNHNYCRLDIV